MLNLFLVIEFHLIINAEGFAVYYEVLLGVALVTLVFSLLYHVWYVRHHSVNRFHEYESIGGKELKDSDYSLFVAAKRRNMHNIH